MFSTPIILISLLVTATTISATPTGIHKRAISCLKPGSTATATWTDAQGKTCRWTGTVGSNFGPNSGNGGEYSCNGRCGAGCSGFALGNAYTQDCFSHDVCSWFNNASGGASDPNCGAAYNAAVDDTLMGAVSGCGETNPSNAVQVPSNQPTCS
ncbi:unnamed protein product [Periconia digitata]|uniref:DUF8213 domain-containing protein n=1 Tax=Periconia digitata TaxID=1303443 RepID=A0A9W4U5M5_9PLEO|nr:unnamed protein product [Periconia digitata]